VAKPQKTPTNWFVSLFAIVVIILGLGIYLPECATAYRYRTVNEARSWGHWEQIEDAKIIDEIGDTNGPYKLVKSIVSGVGKPFHFDLTFNGSNTNWTQPVSNHMWFVVTVFENRRANQFAVIRKRTEQQ